MADSILTTGPHLPEETLAAYHAGTLSPAEDDAIQEHLAGCRLCAQVLLELAEPLDVRLPPAADAPVPGWAAVRDELARDGWFAAPLPVRVPWWRQLLSPPVPVRWAVASLAAVLVATGLFLARTPERMVTVSLGDPTRGGEDVLRVPPQDRRFRLHVELSDLPAFPEYGIEIRDSEEEKVLWRTRSLHPEPGGRISATLPRRGVLPDGHYVLDFRGFAAGKPPASIQKFYLALEGDPPHL